MQRYVRYTSHRGYIQYKRKITYESRNYCVELDLQLWILSSISRMSSGWRVIDNTLCAPVSMLLRVTSTVSHKLMFYFICLILSTKEWDILLTLTCPDRPVESEYHRMLDWIVHSRCRRPARVLSLTVALALERRFDYVSICWCRFVHVQNQIWERSPPIALSVPATLCCEVDTTYVTHVR